jgi:hypothetical protein
LKESFMPGSASTSRRVDPLDHIQRTSDGEGDITGDDAAAVRAVYRAMERGATWEQAHDMAPNWHRWLRDRRVNEVLAAAVARLDGESERERVKQLQSLLQRYRATRYERDCARGFADADDRPAFALLTRYRGKIPSYSTLRDCLKKVDEIKHATGEGGGMALKLRKSVDPTPTSPSIAVVEDDDARLAARLPVLLRDARETDHKLREMYALVGLDIDWAWRPSQEADEVAELLTGRSASAAGERGMPLAAQHAALRRHRANLDTAITVCQRADARVAERERDARIAAARPQILALVRERVRLAVQLQRKNRQLMELGQALGVDPAYGLPSSGFDLLGPGSPGDEVSTLIDALLPGGHLSRKDILDVE